MPIERLGRAWSAVTHLAEVADTPALREAYHDALPRITDFYTRLGADPALYCKYRQIAGTADALKPAQRQALQHTLREFVLGGAELQGAARERFAQIQERAAELQQRYGENVLDATDRFSVLASEAEMAGVPQDVRLATRVEPAAGAARAALPADTARPVLPAGDGACAGPRPCASVCTAPMSRGPASWATATWTTPH